MKKINCTSCVNTHCFIQQHCSPEAILSLKKFQMTFKKGQNIITEGFPVLGIFFIQKGKVKVFSTGLNGRQQIVRFAADGHILGHRGYGLNDVYPISAVAMEDSTICFIENDELYKIFMGNPAFTIGIMMFYSRELLKVETRIKNIAQMNIREKVADALLMVMENFGLNEYKELDIPLTREDIANIVGTNTEQVSRQISDFEQEGLIAKRGRKIIISDYERLGKIISAYNPKRIKK